MPPQHRPPPVGCPPSAPESLTCPRPRSLGPFWHGSIQLLLIPRTSSIDVSKHRALWWGRSQTSAQPASAAPQYRPGGGALQSPVAPRTPAPVPSRLDALDTPGKWLHARLAGETPGLRQSAAAWPNPGGWPWAGRRLLNSLQGPFSLFKNGTDAHRIRALHHVSGISCMRDGV